MIFPMYRRPGSVAYLDDDSVFLDMLSFSLTELGPARLFSRQDQFLSHLSSEGRVQQADARLHQNMISAWYRGESLVVQALDYWARSVDRYAALQVCVIDFSMPMKDGLQVCREIDGWHGARVLLTGRADERLAIDAFNEFLIDQFVDKAAPNLWRKLPELTKSLQEKSLSRHNNIWRATFSEEQARHIHSPEVARKLHHMARYENWVEYVAMGSPFGVLALDADGQASWLQIEMRCDLAWQADQAQHRGLAPDVVAAIRAGSRLTDLRLQEALGRPGAAPRVSRTFPLGTSSELLGAIFDIDAELCPGPQGSYNAFIASQGGRQRG
ncbi:MAG: response regulator [Burkholderiaceae bacterium]|nr:response regulator [Burkholderiaceae bacterium]